ncbi:MAG: flagellar hook capping FlgD N-terminal domain-containing protein [Desulfarculaceae bacterium]
MISPTYQGELYDPSTTTQVVNTDSESGMGQDAFMKMFMAQVTNQNPLDPMDNTEFTAQLATFSQLEQLTKIAESMEGMEELKGAMNQSLALGYIGKEVTLGGDLLPVNQGYIGKVSYYLENSANVSAVIKDDAGDVVAEVDLGYQEAGSHDFQWDGLDNALEAVPDGIYQVVLSATDSQGDPVNIAGQTVTGLVTGYQKGTDGEDYLLMGDAALPLSDVLSVSLPQDLSDTYNALKTYNQQSSSTTSGTESETSFMDFLKGLATVGGLAALL